MTREEVDAILGEIADRAEKLRDEGLDEPDADKGKVVWSNERNSDGHVVWPHGATEVAAADALTTLYDISCAALHLTFFDEAGREETDELTVAVVGEKLFDDAPLYYWRKPLKALLESEMAIYRNEANGDTGRARLIARLIRAFDEPIPQGAVETK